MNVINCQKCGRANVDTATNCLRCGYRFGDPLEERKPVYISATANSYPSPYYPQQQISKKEMPSYVEIGLMGIKTRESALSWLYASFAGVALSGLFTTLTSVYLLDAGLIYGIFFGIIAAAFFSLSSLWYWSCISWMDANDGWSGRR